MVSVNITETRKRMNELIDRALAGEEVIIMRGKKPIARMKPLTAEEFDRSNNELPGLAAARKFARRNP
ncbi:type II toxin-antitoxin system Phd/YefM family antitoxin [Allomesorhizobium camelthorni]|uniref:Antitoxin n=1 Tax=Allomesorhizobium camelthorni TaxID=475069 RepID=A0A6G4WCR8_9HYPH|nr:type II toxin-antitoxin system Phd/YefM family antitoxin [Mesorhizobium camelthorni]NGO52399.1 type II toxin-antitoxin system Phd/YefM family antitoxin [Mesorhizobium camelthorni]